MGEDAELIPVEIVGVRQHLADDEIVVLLLDPDSELLVPILIGPTEASAIASAQAGIVPPRPMTHDLLRDVLIATGSGLTRVEITRLEEGVFHAELVLRTGPRVDSRASDAIALALRFGCPGAVLRRGRRRRRGSRSGPRRPSRTSSGSAGSSTSSRRRTSGRARNPTTRASEDPTFVFRSKVRLARRDTPGGVMASAPGRA